MKYGSWYVSKWEVILPMHKVLESATFQACHTRSVRNPRSRTYSYSLYYT